MRHDFIDRYSRLTSPIHSLPAPVKLVGALVILVLVVTTPVFLPYVHVAIALLLLGIAAVSRIPPKFLAKRLVYLEPFAVGAALLTLFQANGVAVFAALVVKSTLCLLTMILLANSTPFADILDVLKRWHFPALLVTTLALMYRYLFLLIDEAERMGRARASRTFVAGRRRSWHLMGTIVGQLGVRSTERAERIYAAMRARGWR
jgi:cobalt/nickel transport system permease protein